MEIDQRNAGSVVTANGGSDYFPVDRFHFIRSGSAVLSLQRSSEVPTGAGFTNSIIATVTTADSSLSTDEGAACRQIIEGFNTADFQWGTASAKTVTLSFWVRSSITGTHSGAFANSDNNRAYAFTYTISSANTWEQKTVTIAGDTAGTWGTTNGRGVQVIFNLGYASGNLITAGSWTTVSTFTVGATGSVSVIGTLNATWYITGVQLEVGSTATPFERRQFGTELALCQRYYQQYSSTGDNSGFLANGYCDTSSRAFVIFQFPVYMRTAPSLTVVSATAFGLYNVPADTVAVSSITLVGAATTVSSAGVIVNSSGVFTAGRGTLLKDVGSSSAGRLQFQSEL
jgi:hypothetical protein